MPADYYVTKADMETVANAIRTKGNTTAPLSFPTGMADAVAAIPEFKSPVVQALDVTPSTEVQTFTPPVGVDGYAPVTVQAAAGGGDGWCISREMIKSACNHKSSAKVNDSFKALGVFCFKLFDESKAPSGSGRYTSAVISSTATIPSGSWSNSTGWINSMFEGEPASMQGKKIIESRPKGTYKIDSLKPYNTFCDCNPLSKYKFEGYIAVGMASTTGSGGFACMETLTPARIDFSTSNITLLEDLPEATIGMGTYDVGVIYIIGGLCGGKL